MPRLLHSLGCPSYTKQCNFTPTATRLSAATCCEAACRSSSCLLMEGALSHSRQLIPNINCNPFSSQSFPYCIYSLDALDYHSGCSRHGGDGDCFEAGSRAVSNAVPSLHHSPLSTTVDWTIVSRKQVPWAPEMIFIILMLYTLYVDVEMMMDYMMWWEMGRAEWVSIWVTNDRVEASAASAQQQQPPPIHSLSLLLLHTHPPPSSSTDRKVVAKLPPTCASCCWRW